MQRYTPKNVPSTGVVARRLPLPLISDIVYGEQQMPVELAATIRTLRRDHRLSYEDIMWSLAESDPTTSQCFGFGKALTELACIVLSDHDPSWN